MRRTATLLAVVLALLACIPCFAQSPEVDKMRGKVVAYTSGTAFAVLDPNEKLRRIKLTGVDAPERRQRFAPQARQLASEWLSTKAVDILVDGTDKEARVHGRVVVDGRDVALTLIEAGLAWCDPSDDPMLPAPVRTAYRQACDQAKSQRRGLWQDAHPMPPWEYRRIPEFDPPAPQPRRSEKNCRNVGYQTMQCDDGTSYRIVGSEAIGSDGTVYARRGNTLTGSDGTYYTQQGTSIYGSDGSVCRQRGRQTNCF